MTTGTARRLRCSVGVPNFGPAADHVGLAAVAAAVEESRFDGIWVADHIVLPSVITSRYPYSEDGSFFLPEGEGWYEAVATLAWLAGQTTGLDLGIGVCVVALRDPRLLAAQLATLDRLSGGRVVLGVGAGWLREEFDALEVPFEARGARLDAALDVLRACWTGAPPGGRYGPYTLPDGVRLLPTPARPVPVLVGGDSEAALRRVVARGDGWYGAVAGDEPAVERLGRVRASLARHCARSGRDPATLQLALRVAVTRRGLRTGAVLDDIRAYAECGVSALTFDVAWPSVAEGTTALASLRAVCDELADRPVQPWWT